MQQGRLLRRTETISLMKPPGLGVQGADFVSACRMAMAELILSGCTTTVDHHYFFANDIWCVHAPLSQPFCNVDVLDSMSFTIPPAVRAPEACRTTKSRRPAASM